MDLDLDHLRFNGGTEDCQDVQFEEPQDETAWELQLHLSDEEAESDHESEVNFATVDLHNGVEKARSYQLGNGDSFGGDQAVQIESHVPNSSDEIATSAVTSSLPVFAASHESAHPSLSYSHHVSSGGARAKKQPKRCKHGERNRNIAERKEAHVGATFHCPPFKRVFSTRNELDRHQRASLRSLGGRWPADPDQLFVCAVCSYPFFKVANLLRHVKSKSCFFKLKPVAKSLLQKLRQKSSDDEQAAFGCSKCLRVFSTDALLLRHIAKHACGGTAKQRKQTKKNSYPCDWRGCSVVKATSSKLSAHKNIHLRKYPCKKCGRCCQDKHELNKHRQTCTGRSAKTRKRTKRSCSICDATFDRRRALMIHLKSHDKAKRLHNDGEAQSSSLSGYRCEWPGCGSVKATSAQLRKHMNVHLRRFQCVVCGLCCGDSAELRKHSNDAHKKVKFQCDVCAEVFLRKRQLEAHAKQHAGEDLTDEDVLAVADEIEKLLNGAQFEVPLSQDVLATLPFSSNTPTAEDIGSHAFVRSTADDPPASSSIAVASENENGSIWRCDWPGCFATRFSEHSLLRHRNVHLGKFKCHVCSQCFEAPSVLAEHVKSCAAEISACDASIPWPTEPIVAEPPIQPISCEQQLPIEAPGAQLQSLLPLSTTAWLTCSACNLRFADMDQMREHNLQRHGLHFFKCKICALSFPRFHDLMVHHRSHTST